ncbi:hypothetical protein ACGFZR_01325 [Streptomyces sp. NPDC048241]|uniref:hypothetical protein n=1 Tax=Streptomyces sp. NPDC048241 TaxID=3365521 RepID=UPI003716ED1C
MSEYVRLPDAVTQAIADRLEARGWRAEYVTNTEMELTFPDPDTGHAMRFSGWWLSWRLVDGGIAYGIGDYNGDPWRQQLDLALDASAEVVAEAADQAMHLLWHLDDRNNSRKLHEDNRLLRALEMRATELGRRLLVTQGMIRSALKPTANRTT